MFVNQIFQDDKYLNAAEQFADIVWKRGLLTKGYGLCHGVSGNTYTFMSLYQLTGVSCTIYIKIIIFTYNYIYIELIIGTAIIFI